MASNFKKALITGGSSGIGLATATNLSKKGYQVMITGSNEKKMQELKDSSGFEFFVFDKSLAAKTCDEGKASFDSLLTRFKNTSFFEDGLDALVVNAGIAEYRPIGEETFEQFDKKIAINVKAHYFIIQRLKKYLEMRKGAISVVSSIITNNALPNATLYALSKGALDSMAVNMAAEFAPDIRVNIVSPGATYTPLVDRTGLTEEHIAAISTTIPLQRFAKPEEIADVISAQLECQYVTGAKWLADGGKNIC